MNEDLEHLKVKRGKVITKPIIAPEIEAQVMDAVTQFTHLEKWKEWGIDKVRRLSATILLHGPPGCGKTTIAKYLANKVRKGLRELSAASFSDSGAPGSTEKALQEQFEDCRRHKNMTIFIDECDHLLRNRADISGDGLTWMVSVTEELMKQMDRYPGLIILATNMANMLDPAVDRRLLAKIFVGPPDYTERLRLWKQKFPTKIPMRITEGDFAKLAKFKLTGADIENVIVQFAARCIRGGQKPSPSKLNEAARTYIQTRNQ